MVERVRAPPRRARRSAATRRRASCADGRHPHRRSRGCHERRADRRAQPLAEADRHRVRPPRQRARRTPCATAALKSRAVQMRRGRALRASAVAASTRAGGSTAAGVRVLERQQPRARVVLVVGLDRALDVGQRRQAVGAGWAAAAAARCRAPQRRRPVAVAVRLLPDQVFVAARAVAHDRHEVALRAAGHEQRRLLASSAATRSCSARDRRVVANTSSPTSAPAIAARMPRWAA